MPRGIDRLVRAAGTPGAVPGAMHTIAFNTKRAFHSFLNQTRRLHASFGLTPARFDLLYALGRPSRFCDRPYALQSEIRERLGVSASVVSRMLQALEALGLVTRRVPGPREDRRQRVVTLTDTGAAVMRDACRVVFRSVRRIYEFALGLGGRPKRDVCFRRTLELESRLELLRHQLGDRATLIYAWGHPDD